MNDLLPYKTVATNLIDELEVGDYLWVVDADGNEVGLSHPTEAEYIICDLEGDTTLDKAGALARLLNPPRPAGRDVISLYSRKQAIADGDQIPLDGEHDAALVPLAGITFRKLASRYFSVSVIIGKHLWYAVSEAGDNKLTPMLYMFRIIFDELTVTPGDKVRVFKVKIGNDELKIVAEHAALDFDDPRPVIWMGLAEEHD